MGLFRYYTFVCWSLVRLPGHSCIWPTVFLSALGVFIFFTSLESPTYFHTWNTVQAKWVHFFFLEKENGFISSFSFVCLFVFIQHGSSFKPRILSLKWLSFSKLQKRIQTPPLQGGLQDELFTASEMLVSSIQVRTWVRMKKDTQQIKRD